MKNSIRVLVSIAICLFISATALAQTTEFTYQGSLKDNAAPANANYDFEFALFDSLSGGSQIGATIPKNTVLVANGVFAVKLDFGAVFPGANRYLEIHVRLSGQPGFTTLTPRQLVNSAPYSVKSLNADNATNATNATTATNATNALNAANFTGSLGGDVNGTQGATVVNSVGGQSAANVGGAAQSVNAATSNNTANTLVKRDASGNFSAGTITGNIFDAATQFNIGGSRALSAPGNFNLFAGRNAGLFTTTGAGNAFFGGESGHSNTTGNSNSFFGTSAGNLNSTGNSNSFFGTFAGNLNSTGNSNSFFGQDAGYNNTTGSSNTIIGNSADVGSTNLTNATAIGANAVVSQSNSLVLGNGVNVGIGTSAPNYKLHIVGQDLRVESSTPSGFPRFSLNSTGAAADQRRWQNYAATNALLFTALNDAENAETTWLQVNRGTGTAISSVVLPNGNVGIGTAAPEQTLHVNGTSEILSTGSGAGFKFRDRGSISSSDDWVWYSQGNIARFFRPGIGDMLTFTTGGVMTLNTLGAAGSTSLCRNASNQISTCSSSIRYKQNINPFTQGLSLIKQLRPVSFRWRANNQADFGLVAEEVSKVEPLLTTTNEKGEVEGVKYDRVGVVLVNAVQEQQAQIEAQQKQIEQQRKQIESLTKIVCEINSKAGICRP